MTEKIKVYVDANQYNKAIDFIQKNNPFMKTDAGNTLNNLILEVAKDEGLYNVSCGGFLVTAEQVDNNEIWVWIWVDLTAGQPFAEYDPKKEWVQTSKDGKFDITFVYK